MGATGQILEPLWRPHGGQITNCNLTRFQSWLRDKRGLNLADHRALYDWSVRDLDGFWRAVADFFGVRFHTPAELVLHRDNDPLRTRWFRGGTINYAEHLLRFGMNELPVSDDRMAVLYCAEPGAPDSRQVYDDVKADVWLGSASGGTDVCTAFVLPHPWLPVYAGRLQCRGLGSPIESWDENGHPLWNEVGELVLTAPMPCMPVCFWNDPGGTRLRQAYFEHFPGVWRHGDWIEIDAGTGQCVIYGRSDSTLNRGGVRMGTSEFYRVVESAPEIIGSLVVDTGGLGQGGKNPSGRLLLFVVLREAVVLDEALIHRIREQIKAQLSPRYVPDAIFAVPEIPQTLNGKKLEVPVKRIFQGVEITKSVSREAMSNPDSLRPFLEAAERYRSQSGSI